MTILPNKNTELKHKFIYLDFGYFWIKREELSMSLKIPTFFKNGFDTNDKAYVMNLNNKTVLVTGASGQDGSYLAEFLLGRPEEYAKVLLMCRRSSNCATYNRIAHLKNIFPKSCIILFAEITDYQSLKKIFDEYSPDEVYNLAAQSDVGFSYNAPKATFEINTFGVSNLLDLISEERKYNKKIVKLYQASTSEMFGGQYAVALNEKSLMEPQSPYSVAKKAAYDLCLIKRKSESLFITSGILFNHESPRRGPGFVTKKVAKGVALIKEGLSEDISLGNLNSSRDWGHARDYVKAMYLMMQKEIPDDYVVATGETHTIKEFVEEAFKVIGIKIYWSGEGLEEKGRDSETGKVLVKVDPVHFRPTEVHYLLGDCAKAKSELGWKPETSFKSLVEEMVLKEIEFVKMDPLYHQFFQGVKPLSVSK
jgi:GDPmannose 4,6-dehydratase